MALPKFIHALQALTPEEQGKFEKFVAIYHEPDSEVSSICKHVLKCLHTIQAETSLTEIKGKKFKRHSDKTFANYLSILFSLMEDWLVKQTLDSDPQLKNILLVRGFQNHGLYTLADKYYSKIESPQEQYYHTLLYQWIAHFEVYFSHNPYKYKKGAQAARELATSFKKFTTYTADILKAELINWSLLYPYDPKVDIHFLDCIGGQSANKSFLRSISSLIEKFEWEPYTDLVHNFLINPPLKGSFEEVLLTFYLIRLNTIAKKRSQEIFQSDISHALYDFAFERGVFNQRGSLSPHTFRNLVNNISEINSLPYSLEFIEKYNRYMHSHCPENSKSVCIAMAFLKHNLYDAVIEHTNHKIFHDSAEKIQCYTMHLVAWFVKRKSEPDVYQNVLFSYMGYLKRNPDLLSNEITGSYMQFISVLKDIDKGINPIQISKYTNLMNRNWLTKYLKSNGIGII